MANTDHTGLKRCSKCKANKPTTEFHKDSSCKDGLCSRCKLCNCAHAKAWRVIDPIRTAEKQKASYQKHRPARLVHNKEHRQDNLYAIRAAERERERLRTPEMAHTAYMRRREKALAKNAEWARNNPERVKATAQKWISENIERSRAIKRKSANKFPEKNAEKTRRRVALKRHATPAWADKKKVLDVYKQAQILTLETGVVHHVDHVVPLKHSLVQGLHCEANLQILRHDVNESKGNRYWPDMP